MPNTSAVCVIYNCPRRLNCVIAGESIVFSVTVRHSCVVDDLREVIQCKRALGILKDIDPHTLERWKPDDSKPIAAVPSNTLVERIRSLGSLSQFSNNLEPTENLFSIFPKQPSSTHIHIIVKVPPDDALLSLPKSTRKRKNEENPRFVIDRWRSKRIKSELPTIAELARIVNLPLSDEEKIPISPERMEALVSIELQDICTMSDVQLLFRPGYYDHPLESIFFTVTNAPPIMGTENSFIQFWDNNVRSLLELLVPSGRSIRNHNAMGSLCPDYAFLVNKLCMFWGEEKAPNSRDDPKKELSEKIVWTYKPAPYVLGYYATGPDFTLVAISPPLHEQGLPVVHDIAYANLRLRADRIKNICRLINLAGLFQQLADIVQPSDALGV